jgi:hypothetical protein
MTQHRRPQTKLRRLTTPLLPRLFGLESYSCHVRQQCHIPGALNSLFHLSLTTRTIAAALARVYLAAMRQKFLQRFYVFVIDVLDAPSAKPTLRPFASPGRPAQRRSCLLSSSSHIFSSYYCSHPLTHTYLYIVSTHVSCTIPASHNVIRD